MLKMILAFLLFHPVHLFNLALQPFAIFTAHTIEKCWLLILLADYIANSRLFLVSKISSKTAFTIALPFYHVSFVK